MGGGLSKDNAQECKGGDTLHGSGVDKAGTSTRARGLGGGTRRCTRFGASIPRTLSGRERCGVDRRGGGGCDGRALLFGEIGTLQKWVSISSFLWWLVYIPQRWGRVHSPNRTEYVSPLLAVRPRGGTYCGVLVHVVQGDWLARSGKVTLRSEGGWLSVEQEYVTVGSRVLRGQGTCETRSSGQRENEFEKHLPPYAVMSLDVSGNTSLPPSPMVTPLTSQCRVCP